MTSPSLPQNAASSVADAVHAAQLDLEALVALVDRRLADELFWLPVRHHSPSLARLVDSCIRRRRPRVVFVEGPAEAQGMIEFLLDEQTKPPVAIYSSFRRRDGAACNAAAVESPVLRSSVWFPLVSYSPEYVALEAAKAVGAEVRLIDLPHYAHDAPVGAPQPTRRDLDQVGATSEFYRRLAAAGGYRSWSEAWDALFETPRAGRTDEQLRREAALFCAAVRSTVDTATLAVDGTLARERFMWRTIREVLAASNVPAKDAIIVCGGFHMFLDQDDETPPPSTPDGVLQTTVAPYSYFRISELSGYGAGNRAPRYYEKWHESQSKGVDPLEFAVQHIVDVVHEARRRGERLSPADAIGAAQHALMLARLRGRSAPILDDLYDGLVTCCAKGDPHTDAPTLLAAMDEVNIGTKLGKVTPRLGRLPILSDFYEQLERLDLQEIASRERVCSFQLDKRTPQDALRSAFLHRLVFLGVEVGTLQRDASAFGQSVFKESWRLRWSPKWEAALIERNLHGDTVELAAMTLLAESMGFRSQEAGFACRRLVQAIDMDLPQLVVRADQMAGHSLDYDDRFTSLADALTSLLLLERYAAYRNLGKERLEDLVRRCFTRACLAVPDIACSPPEEWDQVVQGLLALAEPVVQRQELDADLFASQVESAARQSKMPYLRGALLGMLAELRRMTADALEKELSGYARASADQQVSAGDFLAGVLAVSKTALLVGAKPLVAAVDELLRAVDDETFLNVVPRLRAAFEGLHERQRDGLAGHVAELYGLTDGESLRKLSTSVGAARLLADLDAEAARILQSFLGEK